MKTAVATLVLAVSALTAHGYSVPAKNADASNVGRRQAIGAIVGGSLAFLAAPAANALDMDAFVNAELDADKAKCNPKVDPKCNPKMTADEALCMYGSSGKARGEACKKVKAAGGSLPGAQPQGKSLGGAYAM